jgi:hypothetical protein
MRRWAIGFTGTRAGMTPTQIEELRGALAFAFELGFDEFHHGDCVGADAQAHAIALEIGFDIVIHPPIVADHRAYSQDFDQIRSSKPYLERNHDIVDETRFLIAAPKQPIEVVRSGTWATVRYARKKPHGNILVLIPGPR